MTKTFLILTIVCGAIGFLASNLIISAMGKALAGTFFILAFLLKLDSYWAHEKPNTNAAQPHGHPPGHGHGHSH